MYDVFPGHQIACHLHEIMDLAAGGNFQIYQQFNGNNVTGATYNSLHIERVLTHVAAYTTTSQQTSGFKTWSQSLRETKEVVLAPNQHTFTVSDQGLYRIVVKVNGATSGGNSDHIALHVNGSEVSRSMAGLNTGVAFHNPKQKSCDVEKIYICICVPRLSNRVSLTRNYGAGCRWQFSDLPAVQWQQCYRGNL